MLLSPQVTSTWLPVPFTNSTLTFCVFWCWWSSQQSVPETHIMLAFRSHIMQSSLHVGFGPIETIHRRHVRLFAKRVHKETWLQLSHCFHTRWVGLKYKLPIMCTKLGYSTIRIESFFLLWCPGENTWDDIFMINNSTSATGDKIGKVIMSFVWQSGRASETRRLWVAMIIWHIIIIAFGTRWIFYEACKISLS